MKVLYGARGQKKIKKLQLSSQKKLNIQQNQILNLIISNMEILFWFVILHDTWSFIPYIYVPGNQFSYKQIFDSVCNGSQ